MGYGNRCALPWGWAHTCRPKHRPGPAEWRRARSRVWPALEPEADLGAETARRRHVELGVADLALGDHVPIVPQVAPHHRDAPAVTVVGEPRVPFGIGVREEGIAPVERPAPLGAGGDEPPQSQGAPQAGAG